MASDDFADAYVRYLTQFPDLASLGSGNPPALWKAELDAVSPTAFDAVLATQVNMEGGGSFAGSRNFPQMAKVRALYAVRAALDGDYVNPYTLPIPDPLPPRRMGSIVRLGYGGCS